ncbi:LPS export ABC transporter protein LptC [Arenibacter algicola]|uniref:LPS export ABC transporter protein LptC n=1 Tax=Arenibacter algicola TaxID=616991 RepID=A0ABY3AG82_9FLAO|nr:MULTISPECIES: LPS export ABC transporter periplasmic protein LptC [Arenibacter]GBF22347.1 lipopolysaccharide-assembly, LptC-related [Arenibacter sp. NBRC 103722]|tara:strand:- start:2932 stop:3540 length:609 start_codon:yes stop_codon:yes gene_type:complete
MKKKGLYNLSSIAIVFSMAMLFYSCADNYKRVGDEAIKKIFPSAVAEEFTLTYTETDELEKNEGVVTAHVIAVLKSPVSNEFDNLTFPYTTFPNGLILEFFDEKGEKNTVTADYGIIYSSTNLIDLQGNVVMESSDGKKLEAPQLYWDRSNDWIFTQRKFKYTNPEEGTIMDGEGMDFNRDFSFFNANKTYGYMSIKEKKND